MKLEALLNVPVFFSMCTRPFKLSRGISFGSSQAMSISRRVLSVVALVAQNIMKESFTKCVIEGVDGRNISKILTFLLLLLLLLLPEFEFKFAFEFEFEFVFGNEME